MATINVDDVRVPRRVWETVTRHEQVVVLNRVVPVLAIVHPDDLPQSGARRRDRAVGELVALLAGAPTPGSDFANDSPRSCSNPD